FVKITGFEGVIGCIDGSYIHIRTPAHKLRTTSANRHNMTSIVLQAVCNSHYTPCKDLGNLTPSHAQFNEKLSATRVKIENAFGWLKIRFRQLMLLDFHTVHKMCELATYKLLVKKLLVKKNTRNIYIYFCDRCLHYLSSNIKLELHSEDCEKLNDCAIKLPSEDNKWLSFNNHCRKERVPFVVYADP
ncbi:hypothetical protein ALC60_14495, partial [Trachymyrmex zeteki]